jgi:hypothetical protein
LLRTRACLPGKGVRGMSGEEFERRAIPVKEYEG